jgi:hypothetical protein
MQPASFDDVAAETSVFIGLRPISRATALHQPPDDNGSSSPAIAQPLGDPRVKLYCSNDSQPEGCGNIELQE